MGPYGELLMETVSLLCTCVFHLLMSSLHVCLGFMSRSVAVIYVFPFVSVQTPCFDRFPHEQCTEQTFCIGVERGGADGCVVAVS